ncbi:3-hydroxyacyl-CoA dehydrogenase NAD-binding domain-containing protein [Streptomyces sp. SudanB52_2052]|uniref:3-hydroxyacyl-CoA dehydrogenase NAD-binding domain-containing protein n=1 Tax=Streptomyces sp. SudanB52_2052 TaxID=3035276 RepID=UPI003F54A6A7
MIHGRRGDIRGVHHRGDTGLPGCCGPSAWVAATGPLVRWGRIRGVTRLDGAADRDLLVETTAEDETATVCPFQRLDAIAHSPRAVLASSASSIPIMKPAVATSEPATGSRSCCARRKIESGIATTENIDMGRCVAAHLRRLPRSPYRVRFPLDQVTNFFR